MSFAPSKLATRQAAPEGFQQASAYYESIREGSDIEVRDMSRALANCRQADMELRRLRNTTAYDRQQHVANSVLCMRLARVWKSRLVNTPREVAELAHSVFTIMMEPGGEQKLSRVAIETIDDYNPSLNLIDNLNRTIKRLQA